MSQPLVGKVAAIIDEYTVALNIGREKGVEKGMTFEIVERGGIKIKDPDSKELLGTNDLVKARVQIKEVYEKFSTAESFVFFYPPSIAQTLASMYIPSSRRKRLPVSPPLRKPSKIIEGDIVRQILESSSK